MVTLDDLQTLLKENRDHLIELLMAASLVLKRTGDVEAEILAERIDEAFERMDAGHVLVRAVLEGREI